MKKFAFLSHYDLNLYLFRLPIMIELIALGHEVYAIYPKSKLNEEFEKLGIKVVNYEINRKSLNPFSEKKAINAIYQAIKDLDLDVLHTFTAKPNIYGTIAGKKAKIPKIFNLVEGLGSFYVEKNLKNNIIKALMERLYKKTFKLSNGCIFVNEDDPLYMCEKGLIQKEKVTIIKSVGVDSSVFDMKKIDLKAIQKLKQSLQIDGKKIVLMVARAIWHKGVKEYYEAAKIIKQNDENVEFLYVGGTDDGNVSCASIEFLNSKYVKYLNQRDDIIDLTAICDVYVLPSYREGIPRTLLEAASMSKAIVTSDTVGCKEVVDDGINGFLVPIKDAKTLAKKINILLNNDKMRLSMGEFGRQKVLEEFDIKQVLRQYLEFYKKNGCLS